MFKLFFDRLRPLRFGMSRHSARSRSRRESRVRLVRLFLALSVLLVAISEVDYEKISNTLRYLGRMKVPIVDRHPVPYPDGTTAEWMYVRFILQCSVLCCPSVRRLTISLNLESSMTAWFKTTSWKPLAGISSRVVAALFGLAST